MMLGVLIGGRLGYILFSICVIPLPTLSRSFACGTAGCPFTVRVANFINGELYGRLAYEALAEGVLFAAVLWAVYR